MISWCWLILAVASGVVIGLVVMEWLIARKIADLEDKLWASQMSWENPLPFLGGPVDLSFDNFLHDKESSC